MTTRPLLPRADDASVRDGRRDEHHLRERRHHGQRLRSLGPRGAGMLMVMMMMMMMMMMMPVMVMMMMMIVMMTMMMMICQMEVVELMDLDLMRT
jgi:hypothetical protein